MENLVSNAVKYSVSGGSVTLRYGAAPSRGGARHRLPALGRRSAHDAPAIARPHRCAGAAVWLRVEDEGRHRARTPPRLGERFYRADQSRGGKITGTGLGLAIVKHIMAHHRGGLAVETRLTEGTAFGVWMPVGRSRGRGLGQRSWRVPAVSICIDSVRAWRDLRLRPRFLADPDRCCYPAKTSHIKHGKERM